MMLLCCQLASAIEELILIIPFPFSTISIMQHVGAGWIRCEVH
jgi:hypothetical protein